ncbi:hypothetical protein G6F70_001131 [Rhizopus microsporus]|uniref:Uncharacterized protein n=2 Tax=Rhizopus TaxID=4842 RepID=A0A367JQB6_RHIAZ|nr:hypothetical protein G6F71_001108 [Rhizopus microsporus]RCH92142.1 hypothetical protein CU097_011560 [Rhizopus azygosporus]KAG1203755.1 hypothetical protein G6F70_001131 [Rhizopus microsporus]KAG1216420.1 hypothetical protein G6F69_000182 [Rhizopus microsporus]KAG1237709.1 hypothetical protein G6F67_001027 [Rhizopus microsporus]
MVQYLSSAYYSTAQELINLASTCKNITAGPDLYQLYCQSTADPVGSCYSLPSKYLNKDGSVDCFTVTTSSFLTMIYQTTGNVCGIHCYYPTSFNFPSISIPSFNIPTYSYPSQTTTTPASKSAIGTPPATTQQPSAFETFSIAAPASGNAQSTPNANTSNNNNSGNNGNSPANGPFVGGSGLLSSSHTIGPNFILTFIVLFLMMSIFTRRLM